MKQKGEKSFADGKNELMSVQVSAQRTKAKRQKHLLGWRCRGIRPTESFFSAEKSVGNEREVVVVYL